MSKIAKLDPTRTVVIRDKAVKEVNRRFAKIKAFVRASIFEEKLITNAITGSVPQRTYQYMRDADKIEEFNRLLQELVEKEILAIENGGMPKDHWLNVYVGDAYERGAQKTRALAERNIINIVKLPDYHPLSNLAHIERAETIFKRVFNDMQNVTDTMRGQMSRELASGMLKGINPKEVAKNMVGRVDAIGITRARLIARTEIVESHNQASIKEAALLEEETGVKIRMQWITSLDGRERPTHHERHMKIYRRDEALRLIGEPNCRCSISAYFDIADIRKKS